MRPVVSAPLKEKYVSAAGLPPDANATDEHTTVAELRDLVAEFVRERDWEQFHDPKNLSMAIATEAAELMEHFRWVRNEASGDYVRDPARRAEVAAELADVMAFALGFANAAGIDISSAVREKMARNAQKYPTQKYRGKY